MRQERRRRKVSQDPDQIVRNLTELHVGRARWSTKSMASAATSVCRPLEVGGMTTEFLTLEYAKGDKLYVPVASLHLISRYAGASPENAPLHRLGSDQWEKVKKRAAKQVRDVAAELLEIYARRAARQGCRFPRSPMPSIRPLLPPSSSRRPRTSSRPSNRCWPIWHHLSRWTGWCAAMSASARPRWQCAPPSWRPRATSRSRYWSPLPCSPSSTIRTSPTGFADWPVRLESLSRFRTGKQQQKVIDGLADGTIDIVIGTHKLLSDSISFKDLGLVIIDEEHRFGVRHKERFKALRSEVDLLTLTATPIPRTLKHGDVGDARPICDRHPTGAAPSGQDLHQPSGTTR